MIGQNGKEKTNRYKNGGKCLQIIINWRIMLANHKGKF